MIFHVSNKLDFWQKTRVTPPLPIYFGCLFREGACLIEEMRFHNYPYSNVYIVEKKLPQHFQTLNTFESKDVNIEGLAHRSLIFRTMRNYTRSKICCFDKIRKRAEVS